MSNYSGPARGTDESFKAYKQRQRLSALVVRNTRRNAAGGAVTSRAKQRSVGRTGYKGGIKGIKFNISHVGSAIKSLFDTKQATPARLKKHKAYLAHIAARVARRAAEKASIN